MKKIEIDYNVITGEETITERDETTAEKKVREIREEELAKLQAEITIKLAQKQAVLDKLGITADEAKALLA
jgi:hypothetical protein